MALLPDRPAARRRAPRVLGADRLPRSLEDIYILVTPDGLGDCEFQGPTECALGGDANDGYCGYHAATSMTCPTR